MPNAFDYRKLHNHKCHFCGITTTFPSKICFACLLTTNQIPAKTLAADHRSLPARDFHRECFTRFANSLPTPSDYMYSLSEKNHIIKEREQVAVLIRNSETTTTAPHQQLASHHFTTGITPPTRRHQQLQSDLFTDLLTASKNRCGACHREIGNGKPFAYDQSIPTFLAHSRIPYWARITYIRATFTAGIGWLLCPNCNAIKTRQETRGSAFWRWTRRGIRYFVPAGIPQAPHAHRIAHLYTHHINPIDRAKRAKSTTNQEPFTDRELYALAQLRMRIASNCIHKPSAVALTYDPGAATVWLGCHTCHGTTGTLLGLLLEGRTQPANKKPTTSS